MRLLKVVLAATAACVALGVADIIASGPAQADPVTQEAAASAFNGVWAPQGRGPGGPGGRGLGGGPRFEANANGDVTVSIGAGPVGERPQGGPGGFRGPPPGGPGFGPPPGGPGERGPGMIEISEEDRAKGLEQGDVRTRAQMTEAGKAKFATFDPLLHPTSNCRTPGLPSIAQIPELQEWSIGDAGAVIRHESYGAKRVVHFDQTSHPNETHTTLGHAFGKLDVDTLTIETANLSEEWGGLGRNAPGSDARVVRETYRLVDKDTIEGQIEITDPKFLTRTLRMPVTLKRQPAGTEIVDFPCEVEVAQRDYKYIADGLARSSPAPAP